MGLMRSYDEIISTECDVHDLKNVLPDTPISWSGFPLRKGSKIFHWNLLTQWRSSFTRLYLELHRLVSGRTTEDDLGWAINSARSLWKRLRAWYACLPVELSYQAGLSIGLSEFQ